MKHLKTATILCFMGVSLSSEANVKTVDELWGEIFQKSYQQKSLGQEKEANEQGLARAERHWLPRAYVSGQWFNTNDPTQVFFNQLGQRAVEQADFNPSVLNRPGQKIFRFGSLGIDLPLYEGGMKQSQSTLFDHLVKSSEMELKAKKSEEYSEFSRQYGTVLISTQMNDRLKSLQGQLEKVLKSYQVGSQSNPMGYSGLLGLKGVLNRIEGILSETELKKGNAQNWINTKRQNAEAWTPATTQKVTDFIAENLSARTSTSYSSMILSQELKVRTLEEMKDMEKARFLPRIGLFAQNNLYSGNRDTATSQAYGLYVMWDLFNSDSYGRVGEANAKSMAAQAKLQAYKQEEQIMLSQLSESKTTLEKNLVLIDKSDSLLEEQSQNAVKLFGSGMMNALQLAEVINRRVDLLENKSLALTQYLDINSRLYQMKN